MHAECLCVLDPHYRTDRWKDVSKQGGQAVRPMQRFHDVRHNNISEAKPLQAFDHHDAGPCVCTSLGFAIDHNGDALLPLQCGRRLGFETRHQETTTSHVTRMILLPISVFTRGSQRPAKFRARTGVARTAQSPNPRARVRRRNEMPARAPRFGWASFHTTLRLPL